jgi:hypothetical protein
MASKQFSLKATQSSPPEQPAPVYQTVYFDVWAYGSAPMRWPNIAVFRGVSFKQERVANGATGFALYSGEERKEREISSA